MGSFPEQKYLWLVKSEETWTDCAKKCQIVYRATRTSLKKFLKLKNCENTRRNYVPYISGMLIQSTVYGKRISIFTYELDHCKLQITEEWSKNVLLQLGMNLFSRELHLQILLIVSDRIDYFLYHPIVLTSWKIFNFLPGILENSWKPWKTWDCIRKIPAKSGTLFLDFLDNLPWSCKILDLVGFLTGISRNLEESLRDPLNKSRMSILIFRGWFGVFSVSLPPV